MLSIVNELKEKQKKSVELMKQSIRYKYPEERRKMLLEK